jgi:hypothetical protein
MTYIPSFEADEIEILLVGGGGAGGPMRSLDGGYGGAGGGGGGGQVVVARMRLATNESYTAAVGRGGYKEITGTANRMPLYGQASTIQRADGSYLFQALGGGRGVGSDLVASNPSWPTLPGRPVDEELAWRTLFINGATGGGGGGFYGPDNVLLNFAGGKGSAGGHGATGDAPSNLAYNGGGGGAAGLGEYASHNRKGHGGMGARCLIRVYRDEVNELKVAFGGFYGGGGASGTTGSSGGAGGGADAGIDTGGTGVVEGLPGVDGTGGGGSGARASSVFASSGYTLPGTGGNGILVISYTGKQKLLLSGESDGWSTLSLGSLCVHVLEYKDAGYTGGTYPTFALAPSYRIIA